MSYRKKTLRNMQPVTRRYARVLNDLDGIARRLKNLTEDIARLELDSSALYNRFSAERPTNEEAAALFEEADHEL